MIVFVYLFVISCPDVPEMSLPLLTTVPDLDRGKLPFPHSPSESKPIISPSSSVRSRHTSFAQRLRSTGRSVRGRSYFFLIDLLDLKFRCIMLVS